MTMEEMPQDRHQVDDLPLGQRPWQFTLRSMFILTTIFAVLLSMARMFPVFGVILIGVFGHLVAEAGLGVWCLW
jgi:hypothetical protein